MLAALVGFGLMLAASVAGHRAARRHMRYETWWAMHLYTYLAVALAFSHQFANGLAFATHPLARWWWSALFTGVAGTVLVFRFGVPLVRAVRHDLRVEAVVPEAPGTVSVWIRGRGLERFGA